VEIQNEKERSSKTGSLVKDKIYKVKWVGEDYSCLGKFVKKERGFLIFSAGLELIICRPSSVSISEKE
jgi:hypothetical protein